MNATRDPMLSNVLRWALESSKDPATASADWLAREIDDSVDSAVDLLTRHDVTLEQLIQAKNAYKTMRIIGETSADRRLGARLYLAAIAAAIVRHHHRISRQSDQALHRALTDMRIDPDVAEPLQRLAGEALDGLERHAARLKDLGPTGGGLLLDDARDAARFDATGEER